MECNENHRLFTINTICFNRFAEIANCTSYDANGSCQACAEGFFVNANQCVALGDNCATGTSNTVCTKCKDGFALNSDDSCMGAFAYLQ